MWSDRRRDGWIFIILFTTLVNIINFETAPIILIHPVLIEIKIFYFNILDKNELLTIFNVKQNLTVRCNALEIIKYKISSIRRR